jgi:uncharacterized protein YbjQ (UPF0145 family)
MMRFHDLPEIDRRALAEAARRMLGEDVYKMAVSEARAEAVERLIKTDNTDANAVLIEQATIRALDEMQSRLTAMTHTLINDQRNYQR